MPLRTLTDSSLPFFNKSHCSTSSWNRFLPLWTSDSSLRYTFLSCPEFLISTSKIKMLNDLKRHPVHLISSTARKTPKVHLKFQKLMNTEISQEKQLVNIFYMRIDLLLSDIFAVSSSHVNKNIFYVYETPKKQIITQFKSIRKHLLTEVPILSFETRSSSTRLWTTSFTDWVITPFFGPDFSSSLSWNCQRNKLSEPIKIFTTFF